MLEVKQAYSGQIGDIGKDVAMVNTIIDMSFKVRLEEPFQICVRVEQETRDRFVKHCEDRNIKPLGVAGMILDAALNEYVDYCESLKNVEKNRGELLAEKAVHDHKKESKKKDSSRSVEVDI